MLNTLMLRIGARLARTVDDERGDVPGWVLITLMTAGLLVVTRRGYSGSYDPLRRLSPPLRPLALR
jgi:hypothetical protein